MEGGGPQGFPQDRIVQHGKVLRRRRIQGGLPGSHPGQGSTAGVPEQIDDIPSSGGLQGSLPRQGTLQRNVEQLFEIPVPRRVVGVSCVWGVIWQRAPTAIGRRGQ